MNRPTGNIQTLTHHIYRLEVIVLGDFNDFDAQVLDVNDNRPTSTVLEILKGACWNVLNGGDRPLMPMPVPVPVP